MIKIFEVGEAHCFELVDSKRNMLKFGYGNTSGFEISVLRVAADVSALVWTWHLYLRYEHMLITKKDVNYFVEKLR